MKANAGTIERAARPIIGKTAIALAARGVIGGRGYSGIIPFATALFRFRPLYGILVRSRCLVVTRSKAVSASPGKGFGMPAAFAQLSAA